MTAPPTTEEVEEKAPEPLTDKAVEQWYGRRGMTLMLRGTGVGGDTADRAAPVLVVLFLTSMLLIVPWLTTANAAASLAVALVMLLAAWVGGNLLGRRRPFARIRHIGWFEAVAFVAAPTFAVIASPLSAEVVEAVDLPRMQVRLFAGALVAAWQVLQLAVVFLIVMFGLVSLITWLLREVWRSLGETGSALSATLPVMLGVVFFFFINPGVWSTMGRLPAWSYLQVMLLLLLLAIAFLSSRRQFDLRALTRFEHREDVRAALVDTPAEHVGDDDLPAKPLTCPLTRRQRLNATIVAVTSRLVVAFVIALAVFSFFVVLGTIAIDAATITRWTGAQPSVIGQLEGLRLAALPADLGGRAGLGLPGDVLGVQLLDRLRDGQPLAARRGRRRQRRHPASLRGAPRAAAAFGAAGAGRGRVGAAVAGSGSAQAARLGQAPVQEGSAHWSNRGVRAAEDGDTEVDRPACGP